jgi:hypothetical protein
MSRVSHFQRFTQQENHATNNTLLLLRFFYQASPAKMQLVLNSLLGTDLSVGLTFEQQVRVKGGTGVPDALIKQAQMQIYIETKRGQELDKNQIENHIDTIAKVVGTADHGDGIFLIGLTKEPIARPLCEEFVSYAKKKGIRFVAATFTQILEGLREQCAEYEQDLKSFLDDYEEYLSDEQLLEGRNRWLPVFPCGVSIRENERFGLYYDPPSRPSRHNYRFIGAYDQKAVALVGRIEAVVVTSWEKGKIDFTKEFGSLTDDHRKRIADVIRETTYYDLTKPHRFYLVDRFVRTNARKSSPGGIWGMRYLDLPKVVKGYNPRNDYSVDELADLLKVATWE